MAATLSPPSMPSGRRHHQNDFRVITGERRLHRRSNRVLETEDIYGDYASCSKIGFLVDTHVAGQVQPMGDSRWR